MLYRIEEKPFIAQVARSGEAESTGLVPGQQWIYVNAAPSTVEAYAPLDQRKNRVIPAESDVFSRQEFCPALAYDDIAGDDHFAAEFFHTQPFADTVAAILNAALSFFMSHRKIKS